VYLRLAGLALFATAFTHSALSAQVSCRTDEPRASHVVHDVQAQLQGDSTGLGALGLPVRPQQVVLVQDDSVCWAAIYAQTHLAEPRRDAAIYLVRVDTAVYAIVWPDAPGVLRFTSRDFKTLVEVQ
jgi:hypothetical protein